eukprot:1556384-Amphidinium_carterae.2
MPGVATHGVAVAPMQATPGVEIPDTWLRLGGINGPVEPHPRDEPGMDPPAPHGAASTKGSIKGLTAL